MTPDDTLPKEAMTVPDDASPIAGRIEGAGQAERREHFLPGKDAPLEASILHMQ